MRYKLLIFCCISSCLQGFYAQCSFTVNAGPDQKVCNPGDMVTLNGKIMGSVQEIFWEPPTGLSNPKSPVTKAMVNATTEYILTGRGLSNINLITNGNFEAGNTGFTTDYMLGTTSCYGFGYLDCEGTYGVITNPQLGHTGFAPCSDHTSGSGLMMVLNGSASLQNVWCQTINVMPDMDYIFSAWVTAVVSASPPILQFSINGVNIGNIFNSSGNTCSWEQFQTTWNSGANTTAEICIVNLNTATGGNDFAIDDLSFRKICEIKDTVLVEVEEIMISIENPEIVTCDNPRWKLDASGSSSGPGWKFTWTTSDGKIISGGNTLTPTIEGPGTYYLTICSPLPNCCKTEFVIVNGNIKPPDLQLTVKDTLGCNVQAVSIFSKSRVSPLDYNWSGPNGFNGFDPFAVVTEGGRYFLTITDEFNCKKVDSIDVIERKDNPKISIKSNSINCEMDTAFLVGSSTVNGSQFEWNGPNQFNTKSDRFSTQDTGWYFLKVTSPNGCVKYDSVLLKKDIGSPRLSFSVDTLNCIRDSAVIIITSDRSLDTSYWTGTHPFYGIDSLKLSTNFAGIFKFVGVASNKCLDSVLVNVPIDTARPVVFPKSDTLTCLKTQSLITSGNALTNVSIEWNGPSGYHSNLDSVYVSTPGIYQLIATSGNGCTTQTSIVVSQDTLHPLLSIPPDTLNCIKQKTTLNLSDPTSASYLWSGPNGFTSIQKNPEINIPGTYNVEAILPNGCKSQSSVEIYIDTSTAFLQLFSDTLTCKKDSLSIRATIDDPLAQLRWTGPMGFQSMELNPSVKLSGEYTLTATKANGCSTTAMLTLYRDVRKPEIYLHDDTLNCLKRTTAILGKTNRDSLMYFWTGPNGFQSNDSIITVSRGGTYALKVESLEGCITESMLSIFEDTIKPNLQLPSDTLNCLDSLIFLRLQSDVPPQDILWSGPSGFSSNLMQPSIKHGGQYAVTFTGSNHCSSNISVNIVQDTMRPSALIQSDTITCKHQLANLTATPNSINFQGSWLLPDGTTLTGHSVTANQGGWYNYFLTATNHCMESFQVFVPVDTLSPDLLITGDTIFCSQPNAILEAKSQSVLHQVIWKGPNSFLSNAISIITNVPGIYQATITSPNGCSSVASFNVPIDTLHPGVTTSADSIHCKSSEATLNASVTGTGFEYFWTDPWKQQIVKQLQYKVSQGGLYTFTAINPLNGCTTTVIQPVKEDSLIIRDVQLDPTHPRCGELMGSLNITRVIGGHQGLLFSVDEPNHLQAVTGFPSLSTGSHTLYVQDAAGCNFQKSFEILDIPVIQIQLPPTINIQLGKSGTLNLDILSNRNMIKSIQWSPPSGLSCLQCEDPEANPWVNTEYEVSVVDTNDCLVVLRILVKVENPKVWAPNVFSPNGDQINDWFYLIASEPDAVQIDKMAIYDRWGNQVFQTSHQHPNQPLSGWNGQWNGEKCLPGVFTYWAMITLLNGEKTILKGDVTLLR